MFGHLKAEDFVNLIEGGVLPEGQQSHLSACPRCAETLRSVEGVRAQVTEMHMAEDEHIPEPDWSDFRSDVRNALLSRSVKRTNAAHGWLGGISWKPALTWGFSMLLVFGLTTGLVLWNRADNEQQSTQVAAIDEGADFAGGISEISSMSQTDALDDLLTLDTHEADNLNQLLQEMTREGVKAQ